MSQQIQTTQEPANKELFAFTCTRNVMPDNLAIKEEYASAWYEIMNKKLHTLGGVPLEQALTENVKSQILRLGTLKTMADSIPVLTAADVDAVANTSFGNVVCYGQAFRNLKKVWDRFVIQFGLLRVAGGHNVLLIVPSELFAKRLRLILYGLSEYHDWLASNLGLSHYHGGPDEDFAWWAMNQPDAPSAMHVTMSGRFQIVSPKELNERGFEADTLILWEPEQFYCEEFQTEFLLPFVYSDYKELVVLSGKRFTAPESPKELMESFENTFGAK